MIQTRYKKILQGTLLGTLVFMSGVSFVFAQTTAQPYTVLQPLPGTTNQDSTNCPPITTNTDGSSSGGCTSDLSTYLKGIFNLMIGVGAVAAFVLITLGGFEYMIKDTPAGKINAKEKIYNALWGLGLVIFAYAILYTINPALLSGSLNITSPTVSTSSGLTGGAVTTTTAGNVAGVPMTQDQITQSNQVETSLAASGIYPYTLPGQTQPVGPCTAGQTTGCVDLNGLTTSTQTGLVALKQSCGTGCTIAISGGTEAGHSDTGGHPTGSSVDVLPNTQLNAYMNSLGVPSTPSTTLVPITINGASAGAFYEVTGTGGTSSGAHWHITFN